MSSRSLTRRTFVAAIAAGAAAFIALPTPTRAQGAKVPQIEILILQGKQDPKGGKIDARIPPGAPISQPPFSAYNTWTLLDQKTLPLNQTKPTDPDKGKPMLTYVLVNGETLEVALLESLPKGVFRIGTAISKGASPDLIKYKAPGGETVFIAGLNYEGGIIAVGIKVVP